MVVLLSLPGKRRQISSSDYVYQRFRKILGFVGLVSAILDYVILLLQEDWRNFVIVMFPHLFLCILN